MAEKVLEAKFMFRVVAANPRLNTKMKRGYYQMLQDLISIRKRLPYNTMLLEVVLERREDLAKILHGKEDWSNPEGGWKHPLSYIEGILIMGGWLPDPNEEEQELPIIKIKPKPKKVEKQVQGQEPDASLLDILSFNKDTGEVVLHVQKLAQKLGMAKIDQVTLKM